MEKSRGPDPGAGWAGFLGLGLILLLSVLCYVRVTGFEFVTWDDPQQVTENPLVLSTPGMQNTLEIFGSTVTSHYQPLVTLLMNITSWLSGTDPGAFHAVSLLLHLANIALVYLLTYRLFHNRVLSLFVAAFFAIHPMRVESVAWVTEQKGLLSALFLLSSFLAYTGSDVSRDTFRQRGYYLSLGLFILAMFCKASAAVLPLLLLASEMTLRGRRPDSRLLLRLLPFALAGAALLVPTVLAHGAVTGYEPLAGLSLTEHTVLVFRNLAFYPIATFWPAGLSAVYLAPQDLLSPGSIAVVLALVLAAVLFLLSGRLRRDRKLQFGILFYVITVAPVLQLVPFGRAPMANRFSYLPSVGLLLCVYFLAGKVWRAFRSARFPLIILAAGCFAASCFLTVRRLSVWEDSTTLWMDVLRRYPDASFAYYNLGQHYLSQGDPGKAMEYYNLAIGLEPDVPAYYINRGNLFRIAGEPAMAAEDYRKALSLEPNDPVAYFNLGNTLMQTGDLQRAAEAYRNALALEPSFAVAWQNLGSSLAGMGEFEEALDCFQRALQLDPSLEPARRNIERLSGETGSVQP